MIPFGGATSTGSHGSHYIPSGERDARSQCTALRTSEGCRSGAHVCKGYEQNRGDRSAPVGFAQWKASGKVGAAKKTDCATAPANEGASSCKPGHGAKVGRKKEQAIAALLTERNVEEAARATGIRATTLYRWLKDPEFRAEHLKARLTAFGPTGVLLQQAANPAATTIMKIMVDIATPAAEPFYCRVFRGLWRGGDSVMDEDRRHSGDIAAIRCSAKSASPPAHRNG